MQILFSTVSRNWCNVRVQMTKDGSIKWLSYSLREHRFANGHNLDRARKDAAFADMEFEVAAEIERQAAKGNQIPLKSVVTARRVAAAVLDVLSVNRDRPFSHLQLATVLASRKRVEPKVTRLRTHYLPILAETSPHWHSEGSSRYWQFAA